MICKDAPRSGGQSGIYLTPYPQCHHPARPEQVRDDPQVEHIRPVARARPERDHRRPHPHRLAFYRARRHTLPALGVAGQQKQERHDATNRYLSRPATLQAEVVVMMALDPLGNSQSRSVSVMPPLVPNGIAVWTLAEAAPAPDAIQPMNWQDEVVNVAATMTTAWPPGLAAMRG